MALSNSYNGPNNAVGDMGERKTGWGWVLAYGLVIMLIGVIALFNPFATGIATGVFVSVTLFIYGVLALTAGFSSLSRRARWIEILLGVLSILASLLTFLNPFAGALSLVVLIGAWLFIMGISEVVGALGAVNDRLWRLMLGVLDVGLGGLLLFADPARGLLFLALTVGISFVARGAFLVILAGALRRVGKL